MYQNPADTRELAVKSLPESFEIPEYWELEQTDTASVVSNWFYEFNSDELNKLIRLALDTSNVTVVYHLAGIDASKAALNYASAGGKIMINYGAAYSGTTLLDSKSEYLIGAGVPVSWEPDLWGKVETGVKAANENLLSSIFNYEYTRQSIAASVSRIYFNICAANKVLSIGDEFLEKNREVLEVLKVRKEVGVIDGQDVYLARAQIKDIESTILTYQNTLQVLTRQLEVLTGRFPDNVLKVSWELKELEPVTSIENPVSLIERRPDIKARESHVKSMFYLEEQARLLKYPNLVLTATPGVTNVGILALGTGANLLGPIIDRGIIESRIAEANALQRQALAVYGQSIINAFNEVETNLNSQKLLADKRKRLLESANEVKIAYELSVRQYRIGKVGLFEVLNIQSQWLLKEIELVLVDRQIYEQRVDMYLALGGSIE